MCSVHRPWTSLTTTVKVKSLTFQASLLNSKVQWSHFTNALTSPMWGRSPAPKNKTLAGRHSNKTARHHNAKTSLTLAKGRKPNQDTISLHPVKVKGMPGKPISFRRKLLRVSLLRIKEPATAAVVIRICSSIRTWSSFLASFPWLMARFSIKSSPVRRALLQKHSTRCMLRSFHQSTVVMESDYSNWHQTWSRSLSGRACATQLSL